MCSETIIFAIVAVIFPYVDCCCFPEKLEAIEGVSVGQNQNGTTNTIQAMYNVSYDITNRQAFITGKTTVNGVVYNELMLQDYAAGKQYVVVDGECTVVPFKETMMSCIPPDAQLVMSTYYGFDSHRIDVDMYTFMLDGVKMSLSVTKQGCVPIAQHMMSDSGITDASFVGITLGIKDMSVFDTPYECRGVITGPTRRMRRNKTTSSLVLWRVV